MQINHVTPAEITSGRKKQSRAAAIAAGFEWQGNVFQTRSADLSLIAGRATKVAAQKALGELVPDFQWRAQDDTMVTFTGDDFLRFAIAVDEFVEQEYQKSWE